MLTGSVFAAKELIITEKDSDSHVEKRRRGLKKEMEALQLLRHKRIVEYMDWYEDVKGRYILVMECCQYGSLDHIIRQATSALTAHDIAEILKQAAEGLLFLHGRGVAHRDLKPANILVRSRSPLCLALGDFGLSRTEGISHMETNCGTWPYMAPEIWKDDHYTKAVDIWALGVVGLELLNNELPTLTRLRRKEYPDIIFDKVAAMYDKDPENRLVANVRKMLAWHPEDRLPASECIDDANDVLCPAVTGQRSTQQQHSTQKRGTDALPRSNSVEAPPPKIPRVEEHRRPQERSTDARSRPRDSLGSTGQQLTEQKSTSALPKPNPSGVPKQQPVSAERRIAGTGAVSRPEVPGAATRTTPSPERTLRKASPAEEKGQQKDTRAPPQSTSSYNSPSAVERNTTQRKVVGGNGSVIHAVPRASSPAVAAPRQTSIPRGGTSLLPQPPSSKPTAPRKAPRASGDGKRD
jgi:serine/threonine protein kinase